MKQNTLNRSLIQAILKRAIHHVKENPEREMRNLIDLGKMFAKGQFQKEFFEAAGIELEKKNSLYYEIASGTIQKTDNDHLLSFGMNLGYNSLTYGAQQIRDYEDEAGFNIPWSIFVTLSEDGKLTTQQLDHFITQSEEMGIYTCLIRAAGGYDKMKALCKVFKRHEDCAFLFFAEPEDLLAGDILETIRHLKNILVCLHISAGNQRLAVKATGELRRHKIMSAAYYRAGHTELIDIKKTAETAAKLGHELLFTQHDYKLYFQHRMEFDKALRDTRLNLQLPILPFDIYSDVAMVDRSISTEGCLAMVDSDGKLTIANTETGEEKRGYNITEKPLGDILRIALPKRALT